MPTLPHTPQLHNVHIPHSSYLFHTFYATCYSVTILYLLIIIQ